VQVPAGASSAGRLGQFIGVRADGGYVIGAGSRIGERGYTARDESMPVPLPSWISTHAHIWIERFALNAPDGAFLGSALRVWNRTCLGGGHYRVLARDTPG
jgi:hypothetical protein